ncbi:MAG: ATP-binding protein, partial [Actinomycetota bacterium]|nr:ATP-binding protein [Actinomycetota bacterium]
MESQALVEEMINGQRAALVVIGRGGMGKSVVLNDLARVATEQGLAVRRVRGHRLNRDEDFAAVEDHLDFELVERLLAEPSRADLRSARRQLVEGLEPGVLIAENTHWMDRASLGLLASVATRVEPQGLRMAVALRPRAADTELAALTELLTSDARPEIVNHLGEDEAHKALMNSSLASQFEAELPHMAILTGGAPFLIDALDAAGSDAASIERWIEGGARPPLVLEAVRSRIALLQPAAQQVLLAMSFGASATGELIDLLDLEDDESLGAAVAELDDEGLLNDSGSEVIPLVAAAATELQPPIERRRHHRQFAAVL